MIDLWFWLISRHGQHPTYEECSPCDIVTIVFIYLLKMYISNTLFKKINKSSAETLYG